MIGHELGGRYQVIERIGGGGMALVYRAHDILLNRNVAIKVLRNQFVHDEEFIRRFRREAQSAASLSHPNVVSIYDVGQEDDVHYIVMEYVEGKNLNEIIKERAPLQVDEAVRIASQICDALDHAHHNQIIHRDIKPHNILIGRNGRVKVTDFGIARAVTSTTITQTGSVVGSVHYFSPEHAKGVAAGEKSDLYSLGIVLYQMLTGALPFLGESPISVALKHLQEEFEEPRQLNPLIPQSVENVILRSMRKNPEERYQSAKEMLQDLETCLLPERRSEAKADFHDDDDLDRTRIIPAIKPLQRGFEDRGDEGLSRRQMEPEPAPASKRKWSKPALWAGITLAVLLILGGLAWYFTDKLSVPEVTVPDVRNHMLEDAKAMLDEVGLIIDEPVTAEYNPNYDENEVYEQSKVPGSRAKKGTHIALTVSTAKVLTPMPGYTGQNYDDVVKALGALGVDQSRIKPDERYSEEYGEGQVIGTDPAEGSEFDPDTQTITVYVSRGKESVDVPDLTGMTESQAKKSLEDIGLVLEEVNEESSFSMEAGKVMKQWPYEEGESAQRGEKFTITLSTGYPPEALNYTFRVPVIPTSEGTKTDIRIVYSDASKDGEKQEWGTRAIAKSQYLPVDLILAPNKDGAITVYVNGDYVEAYEVRYSDAKNGTVDEPQLPVTETPPPTPAPEQTSPDPTIEPEILPPSDGGEGGEAPEGEQTGYILNDQNSQTNNGNGNGKGNGNGNKDKHKNN
ncbi:Stk1 family PASTA domain-containing Ser/Thr kinase [Paenibacillus tengchongensis]|uniref:Stk1 family PASTA domain-containing Ser/Thr kinase n=1 Tax=Paenibacillus tengchongensis TaxID=2608684 RepID=UPI00124C67C1|nr:Stk1 family PASTA domain-containing Ser/Thr kinase [Paenibacillus tengchongensis]